MSILNNIFKTKSISNKRIMFKFNEKEELQSLLTLPCFNSFALFCELDVSENKDISNGSSGWKKIRVNILLKALA